MEFRDVNSKVVCEVAKVHHGNGCSATTSMKSVGLGVLVTLVGVQQLSVGVGVLFTMVEIQQLSVGLGGVLQNGRGSAAICRTGSAFSQW